MLDRILEARHAALQVEVAGGHLIEDPRMLPWEAVLDAHAGELRVHVGEEPPADGVQGAVAQPADRARPASQARSERWHLRIGDGVRPVANARIRDAMTFGCETSAEHEPVSDDHVGGEVLERRLDVV